MITIFGLLLLLGISSSLKYVERRTVLASSGDQFSCFYTIQYSSKGVVSTKKTSVICDPDLDGGNVEEVFDLPKVGPTSIKHSIKKGKESIKKASAYSGSSSSSMVLPMNCSCKADFPHQLMEVIKPGEMMATGRGSAASRGGRGGGKGGVGFLLGPLLLVLLLPTFITSLQALLAGRSLNLDTLREELADKLADRLNSGEFELADVDRLLDQPAAQRTFFLSLLLNRIRSQIQAQIQALLAPLLGRRLEVSSLKAMLEERGGTSFSSSLFSQLQTQLIAAIQTAIQNFLAGLGLGRSLGPLQERQLLQTALQNCIAQIQTAIQNFLAALGLPAGRTGLSSTIFSSLRAQILAAIQTAITNFLNSLGLGVIAGRSLDLEAADRQLFGNLLGALTAETQTTTTTSPPAGDIQDLVNMIDQMVADMTGVSGGVEEMVQGAMQQMMTEMTGMSGGFEEMMAMMEQLEQMSDEEMMQQVMEMMEANGGLSDMFGGEMTLTGEEVMAMFMAEFEKPANCHCLPSEAEHGLLAG